MNIIETTGLGKRYRRNWALRDCTLGIPGGHVVALVGPNGAGKTTMLSMAVGLTTPTAGRITVLGGERAGSSGALDGIAFVAQDAPLYKNLPAGDMLHLTRNLNRRWDQHRAETRLAELGIPLTKKVGKLSGGQQAQLALTVALARRPDLLVLDEPLAMLDPLAGHRVLTGPTAETDQQAQRMRVVQSRRDGAQSQLLVKTTTAADPVPPGWAAQDVSLEELVLAYLREGVSAPPGPAAGRPVTEQGCISERPGGERGTRRDRARRRAARRDDAIGRGRDHPRAP